LGPSDDRGGCGPFSGRSACDGLPLGIDCRLVGSLLPPAAAIDDCCVDTIELTGLCGS